MLILMRHVHIDIHKNGFAQKVLFAFLCETNSARTEYKGLRDLKSSNKSPVLS